MAFDDPHCAFDMEHLEAWGIIAYVQDVFGRNLAMAFAPSGAHFEPVEMGEDPAEALALLRLWVDVEMYAEEIGLAIKTDRPAFGADPTRVRLTFDGDSEVIASAPCDRVTAPMVAFGLVRRIIVDAIANDESEPEALDPEIRWGLQHGIA